MKNMIKPKPQIPPKPAFMNEKWAHDHKLRRILGIPYNKRETFWWIIKHVLLNIYWSLILFISGVIILVIGYSSGKIQLSIGWSITIASLFFLAPNIIIYCYRKILPWIPRIPQIPEENFVKGLNELDESQEPYKIGFVGDIMKMNRCDLRFGRSIKKFFKDVDLIVGNLEGTITIQPAVLIGQKHSIEILKQLKQIKEPGKWLLCLSNNHSGDFGFADFNLSLNWICWEGFKVFGRKDIPNFIYKKDGCDFELNFVSGTMWSNQRKCPYITRFECEKGLKDKNDYYKEERFNILFPHWNYENETFVRKSIRDKCKNLLRGENDEKKWDLIFGHHPHVPQRITYIIDEQEGNIKKLLAYSGGNFTSREERKKHIKGLIAKCYIGRNKDNYNELVVGKVWWSYTKSITLPCKVKIKQKAVEKVCGTKTNKKLPNIIKIKFVTFDYKQNSSIKHRPKGLKRFRAFKKRAYNWK